MADVAGDIGAKCLRCKQQSAANAGDRRAGREAFPRNRPLAQGGLQMWRRFEASGHPAHATNIHLVGKVLRVKEVFAGCARWTEAMVAAGAQDDGAVELYDDPARKTGPRADHDLLDSTVQQKFLAQAHAGTVTHWMIELVCTSFCSWHLGRGGTRTKERSEGAPDCPRSDRDGNPLAAFSAALFVAAADSGSVVTAENPTPDGRYPSAWELPCGQKVLARADVLVVPLDQCEYGLGPVDQPAGCYRRQRA